MLTENVLIELFIFPLALFLQEQGRRNASNMHSRRSQEQQQLVINVH
jgi:hypothetical protein